MTLNHDLMQSDASKDSSPLEMTLAGLGGLLVGVGLLTLSISLSGGAAALAASPLVAITASVGYGGPMTMMVPAAIASASPAAGAIGALGAMAFGGGLIATVIGISTGILLGVCEIGLAIKNTIFGKSKAQEEKNTEVTAIRETKKLKAEAKALVSNVKVEERKAAAEVEVVKEKLQVPVGCTHLVGLFKGSTYVPAASVNQNTRLTERVSL